MTEDLIAIAREIYGTEATEQEIRFAALIEARAVARTREECAALVQANADACEPGSRLQVYLASNAAAIRAMGERT